ncbi:antirestriction protein ArdA [Ferriphaselus sp. R-1]|uniref:antirestriction protein ArdA n=1 Tax=Ferriphaselus sp. R-1 TaxID=1485544 RepID=UPI00054F2313|nr:antirestriction protein ArdA [Ferriphaselus sp. R-1]
MIALNATHQTKQTFNPDAHQKAYPEFYAQPYNLDARGFYFTTTEEFETLSSQCVDAYGLPVEEFEIQFIDGTSAEADLFRACSVNQANLGQFLALLDETDDHQLPALAYLCDLGYSMEQAMNSMDDVTIFHGNLSDAAEELFDECYLHQIPEHLHAYIDYDCFANDCQISGDMVEFEFGGETYTITNAAVL